MKVAKKKDAPKRMRVGKPIDRVHFELALKTKSLDPTAPIDELVGPGVEIRKFATEKDWIDAHHGIITSSIAAGALGLSPFKDQTPLATYMRVRGEAPPIPTTPIMQLGLDLEDDIAAATAREEGWKDRRILQPFCPNGERFLLVSKKYPWLGATPDRFFAVTFPESKKLIPIKFGVLELKYVPSPRSAAFWDEKPPLMHRIQVQVQREVAKVELGAISGLVLGEIRWKDEGPKDVAKTFRDNMLDRLEQFALRCKKGRPPEPRPVDVELLRQLHHEEPKSIKLNLAKSMEKYADEWEEAQREIEAMSRDLEHAKDRKRLVEAKLRMMLGSARAGKLPSGRTFWRADVPITEKKPRSYVRHDFGLRPTY